MTRIAILADIHANLPALDAVLADADAMGVDQFIVAGDIVGYGPWAAECVERLQQRNALCVQGNHDERVKPYFLKDPRHLPSGWKHDPYVAGLMHAAKELHFGQIDWLTSLPLSQMIPDGIVAHASLDHPEQWLGIDSLERAKPTLEILRRQHLAVGFFGHTHVQTLFTEEGELPISSLTAAKYQVPTDQSCAVLTGSVGCPAPGQGPVAEWVIWHPDERVVEFRNSAYNGLIVALEFRCNKLPLKTVEAMLNAEWVGKLQSKEQFSNGLSLRE